MNTYECEICGAIFNGTVEEAFDAGWDTPERFMSYCKCNNCPIDKTVWWKAAVEKQPLTEADALKIKYANDIYFQATGEKP